MYVDFFSVVNVIFNVEFVRCKFRLVLRCEVDYGWGVIFFCEFLYVGEWEGFFVYRYRVVFDKGIVVCVEGFFCVCFMLFLFKFVFFCIIWDIF